MPVILVDLEGRNLTDEGIKSLLVFKHLKELNLDGTKVTDAGLTQLSAFKELKVLELGGERVTAAGVAKLQKALPDCKIRHNAK